jgi:4,5-dihydroxyphthalate decarboxylase
MARLRLTLALGDYDHTRDVALGVIQPEGIEINWLGLPVEEIFFRFTKYREWEISEMSLGKYVSFRSQNDDSIVGIPVFPSRVFRLSSIYVRPGGRVRSPADLKDARIGVPEWAQTASLYSRGYIVHDLGIPLTSIDWVQGGVNQPGRVEKVALKLPQRIRYRSVPERTLNDMLLAGELDAILSARPPAAFADGSGRIVRLYSDYREAETAYFRKTGVFPIMHLIALRRDVFESHPWVAMNLFKAFEEAKRRSLARLSDITASHAPLAWLGDYVAEMRGLFGDDPFPYGIEPNRRTLEAFLQFGYEQGVCHRQVSVDELFPPQLQASFKV